MKNGKIDVKSVGITIALAIMGVGIGFWDFISQRVNIMNFLAGILKIKPMVAPDLSTSTDLVNSFGFGGIMLLVLIVAIICIAFAMGGIRGMA
jgi:hypothetical protein